MALFKDETTADTFHWFHMTLLLLGFFVHCLSVSIIYPFVAFMVRDFGMVSL